MQNSSASRGSLQISVFNAGLSTPIGDATVRISPTGSQDQTVEEVSTDGSGQSETVELNAPAVDLSLEPETKIQPYSEYDLTVTAQGFQTVRVYGVQILPDTKALQNIRLPEIEAVIPAQDNITIGPHTLWYEYPPKIPEAAVKELPPGQGLTVLPNPVVPEFVVVHDGVPDDTTAANYYIPFADYIKNVASSEIYSTWPTESIEANILAILSFTMNRIYTEWYRGKGYSFTVTSTTAFDQKFIYGRNFFAEISDIVDYLFTTFVTKPDIRQPLLTQYCDGVNVTCPQWLSQWGSKYLGDQGYDAIQILRNYYGQDVFLLEAQKVAGVPVSYPGTPLQTGSTGPNVRTIQEQLNSISNNYPAIPKIRVDGIYGQQTRAAVEAFQGIFGLPQTGIVDFATWYRISNIYVAVNKLAELR
jgi:Putative peptidoglycan-binding domain-containing protein